MPPTIDPVARIAAIDEAIDANRAFLLGRLHCRPETAWGWQTAWNRCPDLLARERDLFRQRGQAQQERDAEAERAHRAAKRSESAKRAARTRRIRGRALSSTAQ